MDLFEGMGEGTHKDYAHILDICQDKCRAYFHILDIYPYIHMDSYHILDIYNYISRLEFSS